MDFQMPPLSHVTMFSPFDVIMYGFDVNYEVVFFLLM
jgi:hypothetical protein